ncbi:GNAT family N-acetyltransferase [Psychromarinibacter sp. C21-152]|uniref:GNAT family N-acetyltransferase n=1 Tax=Psychromarinibacter sediminicola TaxID=3033385 RepID=A0AAE3TBU2_9RHOB|nr:GNAT family N-acetyltransferase [Psychromarinibacter sediminicola]MDF0602965.1 GNAT family N-acetyltransferase [Psychromarinibacter sediminicola]
MDSLVHPTSLAPFRATEPYDWDALLTLLRTEFAYMQGRVDPPSSIQGLTPDGVAEQANAGEVWVIEDTDRPVASVFLTPKPHALYIGKLAVAFTHRGKGHARQLVDLAEARARALGLDRLELQARVELTENHAAFTAMGFAITGQTAHPGYDRPTSVTMQRPVEAR